MGKSNKGKTNKQKAEEALLSEEQDAESSPDVADMDEVAAEVAAEASAEAGDESVLGASEDLNPAASDSLPADVLGQLGGAPEIGLFAGSSDDGSDANKHAKNLAKKLASLARQRSQLPSYSFFTNSNGKILQIKVTINGAYSSYIGREKKLGAVLQSMQKKWMKENQWVEFYNVQKATKLCKDRLIKDEKARLAALKK